MANPSWFSSEYYLFSKQAELAAQGTTITIPELEAAILEAGYTPFTHYEAFSTAELTDPNAYFSTQQVLEAQAAVTGLTVAEVQAAFEEAGFTNAYDWWAQYGWTNGINPSNDFNDEAYLEAKAMASGLTVAEVTAAFVDAGLTPLQHYLQFGEAEGLQATPVYPSEQVAWQYTTALGTTAGQAVVGSEVSEQFTAVNSPLSRSNTLHATDTIDGLGGINTLTVDMGQNFSGFSAGKGLTNIQNVQLINADAGIARTYTGTGSTGVENYALVGDVNLASLGSIANVVAEDRATDLSITYTTAAVAGTADQLNLTTINVANADAAVTVTAAGIETLQLDTHGVNILDLTNVAATAGSTTELVILGDGVTKINALSNSFKAIDAAYASGDLTVNLAGATGVTSVVTGTSQNHIQADISAGNLSKTATLIGNGETFNELILTNAGGSNGTIQYAMSGFDNLAFGDIDNTTVIYSAKSTTGLQQVEIQSGFTGSGTAQVVNLGATDMAVVLRETSAGSLLLDSAGKAIIANDASTAATSATPETNTTAVTLTNASSLEVFADLNSVLDGNITANKASSVAIEINGAVSNDITASVATGVTILQNNKTVSSTLGLAAAAATSLEVISAGTLTLGVGSNLNSIQTLNVETDGAFAIADNNIGSANRVTLSGAGDVTLLSVGATSNAYGLIVDASALQGDLNIGNLRAGNSGYNIDLNISTLGGVGTVGNLTASAGRVTIDASAALSAITVGAIAANTASINASGALGAFDAGAISASSQVTYVGTELFGNTADITATGSTLNVAFTGGLANDEIDIVVDTGVAIKSIVVTGDMGLASTNDYLEIDALPSTTSTGVTINYSTLAGYDTSSVIGSSAADIITAGSGNDTIRGRDGSDTIFAGDGSDAVFSNEGQDLVYGGGGNDSVDGGQGSDTIYGGEGNDYLEGGSSGDDFLYGDNGDDTIVGDAGADSINAGAGSNTVMDAGVGSDVITHNTNGATVAIAVTGTDAVTLTASETGAAATVNNVLGIVNATTSSASVSLIGDSLADSLVGGSGADIVSGGAGADTLLGGAGNDTITAGVGLDTVVAGVGADLVVLTVDGATDSITQGVADSAVTTANTLVSGQAIASGQSMSFGNGLDVIQNFLAGNGGDVLTVDFNTAQSILGETSSDISLSGYLSGTYANGAFTVAANGAGPDTLIVQVGGGANLENNSNASMLLLLGVDSALLTDSNFGGVINLTATFAGTTYTITGTTPVALSLDTATGLLNEVANYPLPHYDQATVTSIDFSAVGAANGLVISVDGTNATNLTAVLGSAGAGNTSVAVTADRNISSIAFTDINAVTLDSGVDITATRAQNALITTAAGINIVTLSDTGTATGAAEIETYNLANGASNTFTLGAAAQWVMGGDDNDTVIVGGLAASGTLNGNSLANTLSVGGGSLGAATISSFQTLSLTDSENIASANVGGVLGATTLIMTDNDVLTMTRDQNWGFSGSAAVSGTGQAVTLTTGGTANAIAGIETYNLADSGNILVVNAATLGVNVNGGANNDAVNVGANGITGDLALAGGNNEVYVANSGSIAGATITTTGAGTWDLIIDSGASIGLRTANLTGGANVQLNSINAAGNETVTVNTATSLNGYTLNAAIENWNIGTINGGDNSVTIGTTAQNVTFGAGNDWITLDINGASGTYDMGFGVNNKVSLANGISISASDVSATGGSYFLELMDNSSPFSSTIKTALLQNAVNVTATGFGSKQLNVDASASGFVNKQIDADIDQLTIVAGNSANSITLMSMTQSFTGGDGNDTVTLGALGSTGAVNGRTGANVLSVGGGILSAATISNFGSLVLTASEDIHLANAGAALGTTNLNMGGANTLTMSVDQNNGFSGTIIGGAGTNIYIQNGGGTVNGLDNIANYQWGGVGSTFVVNAGETGVNLTAAGGSAGVNVNVGGLTVTGTYALGDAVDRITATNGANITGVNGGSNTTANQLTLAGGVTMTAAQYDGFSGGITAAGVADMVTFSTALTGQTLDVAVESYVLANATNLLTLGAVGQSVTMTGGIATISTGALASLSGTFDAAGAIASLNVQSNNTNIGGATMTAWAPGNDAINLAAGVAAITLNTTQNALLGTIAESSVTATLSDAGSLTGDQDIMTYILANGANTFSFRTGGSGVATQTATGNSGGDVFNMRGNAAAGGYNGADTYHVISGASNSISSLGYAGYIDIVQIESGATASTLSVSGSWSATVDSYNNGTITVNAGNGTVDVSLAGGTSGWTITSNANITGSTNADTITGGSLVSQTITGGAGGDVITGGTQATEFYFYTGDVAAGEMTTLRSSSDVFSVRTSTNFAYMNAGTLITGLDGISFGADGSSATFLSAQLSGLTFSVTGAVGAATETLIVDASSDAGIVMNLGGATLANSKASLTGGSGADTITGTNTTDTIVGGASADSITGGSGDDFFVYAQNATGITLPEADTIIGFFTGQDKIKTGVAGLTSLDVDIDTGASYTGFADFIGDANLVFGGLLDVCVSYNAQASGNAWVAINNNGNTSFDSGDSLIVLTGIGSAAGISANDFIA